MLNYMYLICGLLFYVFLFWILKKTYIIDEIRKLPILDLIYVMLILAGAGFYYICRLAEYVDKNGNTDNDTYYFGNSILTNIFYQNASITLMLKYVLFVLPSILLFCLTIKKLSETVFNVKLSLILLILIFVFEKRFYQLVNWTFINAITFLLLAVGFYLIIYVINAGKNPFIVSSLLVIVLLAVGMNIVCCSSIMLLLSIFLKIIIAGGVSIFIGKYSIYLRKFFRMIIVGLEIFMLIFIQLSI